LRKFIKYNHLIANLLTFHTLVTITRALQQLLQEKSGGCVASESLTSEVVVAPDRPSSLKMVLHPALVNTTV
jgi:hypothetical protein